MSINEKIYELRKKKNMSQEELANVLNVSRQTISKWETGESNPDFDKIVPLCNFFEITTDELLTGNKPVLEKEYVREKKKNGALLISMCIIIFVVMSMLIIILDEVGANDSIIASISLICLGAIAVILVYCFLSKSDYDIKINASPKNEKLKLINSIINLLVFLIYIVVSLFFGWMYTWVILIIGLLIKRIVRLLWMLGEDKIEK